MAKDKTSRTDIEGSEVEPIDAIEMLQDQHRAVEDLFESITETQDRSQAQRLFFELADMLTAHTTIEERHFYPSVKAASTESLLEHSADEHLEVKRVLAELLQAGPQDPDFIPKIEEMAGLVEDHVLEEENELFPKVRELLDGEQLQALAQEMAATMVELMQQGQPRQHVFQETEAPAPI